MWQRPPVKELPHVATLWKPKPACWVCASASFCFCQLTAAASCLPLPPACPLPAWERHLPRLAATDRHSTCICIFKLRFVCGLPLGCVYTRIAARRGCASLSVPPPTWRLSPLYLSSTLLVHLALNFYASLRSTTSCKYSCVSVSVSQCVSVSLSARLADAHHRLTYLMPLDTHYAQIPVELGTQIWLKATSWPARLIRLEATTQIHFDGAISIK